MDLSEVKAFARRAHAGQERSFTDKPYFVHPRRVGDAILEERQDEALAAAGYLHDVLEDTGVDAPELRPVATSQVVTIVERVCHDPDCDSKVEAIARSLGDHRPARLVKLYDRLDNVSHLDQAPGEFRARYAEETRKLLDWFEETGLVSDEEELVERIRGQIRVD